LFITRECVNLFADTTKYFLRREFKLDLSLIRNYLVFNIEEILEMLEEYIDEYVMVEHYYEDELVESTIIYIEDIELDYDPGEASKFIKQKYLREEFENEEFEYFLKNNFATVLYINGSSLEIEIQEGRLVCFLGNRGELILRTGLDSYVFSPLFKLTFQPDKSLLILDSLTEILKKKYFEASHGKISPETFSMVSGVCIMAIAKLNELPVHNYELKLSHDEMLLFGLALNLTGEFCDSETLSAIKSIMEQIKSYFPEIEHISPESFESPAKMGQVLDFKRPDKTRK